MSTENDVLASDQEELAGDLGSYSPPLPRYLDRLSQAVRSVELSSDNPLPPDLSTTLTYLTVQEPLTLEQLEMLEYELSHQGIVTRTTATTTGTITKRATLSQRIARDVVTMRWQLQRIGARYLPVEIKVDLPRYLVAAAREIQYHQSVATPKALPENTAYESDLEYLEQWSRFLVCGGDKKASRFQRGLDLVLKVICQSQTQEHDRQRPAAAPPKHLSYPLQILLPISQNQLVDAATAWRKTQGNPRR